MIELMKICHAFVFEAAHYLPNVPDGHKCKNMHGHSYRVEFIYEGEVNQTTGFFVDFLDIEQKLKPLIDQLDHKLLNDVSGLANPTAENIAYWLKQQTDDNCIAVRVYETAMCWAEA